MKKLLLLSLVLLFGCAKDSGVVDTPPQIQKYTLSVTASPSNGGLVNPTSGSYNPGQTVTILASANQYYGFNNWTGNWNGTENQVTITMDSNKTLTANFIKVDNDEDGVLNSNDNCLGTPLGSSVDSGGCALSQLDSDGDGVGDNSDSCQETNFGVMVNSDGCVIESASGSENILLEELFIPVLLSINLLVILLFIRQRKRN